MVRPVLKIDDALNVVDADARGFQACPKCGTPDVFSDGVLFYASCVCRTTKGLRSLNVLRRYWNAGRAAVCKP